VRACSGSLIRLPSIGSSYRISTGSRRKELSAGHRKIILYANPGKEGFYRNLGFMRMRTAMAIFKDQVQAIRGGLVEET
jgi:hypothetical protein